jgi:type IV pilus assembly protein PilP
MMGKYLVIMRYLTSTICIVLILLGCDRTVNATEQPKVVRKKVVAQKEQIAKASTNETVLTARATDAATKPRVVRKKVVAPKKQTANVSRKKTVPIGKTNQMTRIEEKTTVVNTDQPKAGAEAKNQAATNTKTGRQKLVAKKIDVIPTKDTVKKLPAPKKPAVRPRSDLSELKQLPTNNNAAPSDKLIAATSNVTLESRTAGIPKTYDASGKVDPFAPLFREKPVSVNKNKNKKKRIPRTPLERVDLSQLKLVGIILASSGNRALVEESTGKGYVIKKGTYIGMNSGKVVNIKKEKVVVEEEFEDVFGKTKFRQREIKLPKPPGEF